MRVIAGKARRLVLEAPAGMNVRPTTDRIKETLFNILQLDVPGCRFLDLFAGSGAIGIEALSRGAHRAVLVDHAREAVKCMERNVRHTKTVKEARILHMDYAAALRRLANMGERFDIIFVDPPYQADLEARILKEITEKDLLAPQGVIILETTIRKTLDDCLPTGWQVVREKSYKTNKHYFIKRTEEA